MSFFDQLHPDWKEILLGLLPELQELDQLLKDQEIAPAYSKVMRALSTPISSIRVVIFGQDPYPGMNHADGLAFSVPDSLRPLPPSLKNIFKELEVDCSIPIRESGDLGRWADQGVLLLNRILTNVPGRRLAHVEVGWKEVTNEVARTLGERGVVAILWGKNAQELAGFFDLDRTISSPHPSPLSAYRGFFGSRPFSRANAILLKSNQQVIKW